MTIQKAHKEIEALRAGCGATTGHGESCIRHRLCGACSRGLGLALLVANECAEMCYRFGNRYSDKDDPFNCGRMAASHGLAENIRVEFIDPLMGIVR